MAAWRRERLLKADPYQVPSEVQEVHDSDDIEAPPTDDPLPAGISGGSSGDVGVSWVPGSVPPRPSAPFFGLPPGTDVRGMGLEYFEGRGAVAKNARTTRPPTIPPELWTKTSPSEKGDAIKVYLAQLAADKAAHAIIAAPALGLTTGKPGEFLTGSHASLLTDDDIPRLPGEFAALEPHLDRGTWYPPGCIARTLSKKEMDTCPRARRALYA